MKSKVSMSLKDFVAEHKRLIKVLEKGMKKDLMKEAKDQAKELHKTMMKKK